MLIALLFLAAQGSGLNQPQPSADPSAGDASVTLSQSGYCAIDATGHMTGVVGQDAVVRFSWSVVNADDVNFETRIYEHGGLLATVPTSQTFYDYAVLGYVASGPGDTANIEWVFRADVVRKADGAVVSSQTAPTTLFSFGTCTQ